MSDVQEHPDEVTIVVEDVEVSQDAGDDQEAERPRFRLQRTWAEVRSTAPLTVFSSWVVLVLLVAIARVDPWNEWKSWRKWLRADERGWELLIPGLLLAAATWGFIRSHDRWSDEGWSPEVVAMVLLGAGAAIGGVLWGLFALDLRPYTG